MGDRQAELLNLADVIYAGGACDAARQQSADALSRHFGDAAVMLTRQAGALIEDMVQSNWPAASADLCTGPFCDPEANEVLRQAPAIPIGQPLRPDAVDRVGFRSTAIFKEAMAPFGLVHPLGAVLGRSPRDVSFVSLMGFEDRAPFTAENERALGRLMPALLSADRVRRLLVEALEERQLLLDALDLVGRPVAVVDEQCRLRYANRPAAAMIDEGVLLRHRASLLGGASPYVSEQLRVAVQRATSKVAAASLLSLRSGKQSSSALRIEPLRPGANGIDQPLAMVVACAQPDLAPQRIAAVYMLTQREAEVAASLAAGEGVAAIARRSGRSINTIKSEAGTVYEKLGVSGHAEALLRIRSDLGT